MGNLPLSPQEKSELDVEVRTVELQLSTAQPKKVVIQKCLHSARAILAGTGRPIATEIVNKITQIIGH